MQKSEELPCDACIQAAREEARKSLEPLEGGSWSGDHSADFETVFQQALKERPCTHTSAPERDAFAQGFCICVGCGTYFHPAYGCQGCGYL